MNIAFISGSPSEKSKSAAILKYIANFFSEENCRVDFIDPRNFPASDLLYANFNSKEVIAATKIIENANAVVLATPIYKASFSGLLKVFLDVLPQNALEKKIVFPLATGGSLAHALTLEYALKPVLYSLGARKFAPSVFVTDDQISFGENFVLNIEGSAKLRIDDSIESMSSMFASEIEYS